MKILTLFGLTSALGLVRAILNDSNRGFVGRVVAWETAPGNLKEQARRGAAVVVADVENEARAHGALDGAYWRMRGVGRPATRVRT